MRRDVQSVMLAVFGAVVLKLVWTGAYVNYVKEGLGPFLAASAVILIVLGVVRMLVPTSGDGADAGAHEGHDDHGDGGPRVGWLLLLPMAAVFVVAPPALGSYAAERDTGTVDYEARADDTSALPGGEGPVEMSLLEYGSRSIVDAGEGLEERQVALTGFVGGEDDGNLVLARMMMSCCAADGQAIKVFTDAPLEHPKDTWVEVVGTYTEPVTRGKYTWPSLVVESVEVVEAPQNPYL